MDPLILTWRPTAWKDPQPTKNLISNSSSSTTISSLDSSLDSSLMILNHHLNDKVVDDNKNPGWIFCRPFVRLQEPTVRPSPEADPVFPTPRIFFFFKKWSNSSSSTIISTLNSSIILSKWSSYHKIMIYDNDFINNLKNCDDKFSITDHFGDKDDAKITNYHFQKSSIIFKIRGRK